MTTPPDAHGARPQSIQADPIDALRDHPAAGRPASLAAAVEPLVMPAAVAAPTYGRSLPSWWRDHAAGRIPRPVKIGRSTLWISAELRAWLEAGCPDRKTWEAMQRHGRR
jgi:predicted DNA-binding transcriptional regulator AlpA